MTASASRALPILRFLVLTNAWLAATLAAMMHLGIPLWVAVVVVHLPEFLWGVSTFSLAERLEDQDRRLAPLEVNAGTWLLQAVRRSNLSVRCGGGLPGDAYYSLEHVIVLSDRTWLGRTANRWAIAAHELGHAEFHTHHPVAARLGVYARRLWNVTTGWLPSAALYNLFVAGGLSSVIRGGWAFGALLGLGIVVEEIAASRSADGWLAGDPRLTDHDRDEARAEMRSALATYLAAPLGMAVLALVWPAMPTVDGSCPGKPWISWAAAGSLAALSIIWVAVLADRPRTQSRSRPWIIVLRDLTVGSAAAGFALLSWGAASSLGTLVAGLLVSPLVYRGFRAWWVVAFKVSESLHLALGTLPDELPQDLEDQATIPRVELNETGLELPGPTHPVWALIATCGWMCSQVRG